MTSPDHLVTTDISSTRLTAPGSPKMQNSQPTIIVYLPNVDSSPLLVLQRRFESIFQFSGECLSGLVRLSLSSCVDFVAGEKGGLDLEYSSSSKMEAVVELEAVGELSLWRERNVLGASVD